MADVTIYGASDDLIEVEGDVPGCDEYNQESAVFILRGSGEVSGGVTRVTVDYGAGGCWMIGVAPVDEDVSMLPMTMGQQPRTHPDAPGYSARATFTGVEAVELLDADSFADS